jgi:hypothetical protein
MHHQVSSAELAELKRKYEGMLRLRLRDAACPGGDPRLEMAALAALFPGSLRELDQLPLETIRARIEELSHCITGVGVAKSWMPACARFHRLMRGALAAKKWLGAQRAVHPELVRAFRESLNDLSCAEDARLWTDDLERVARPPRGKLTALVFERLAAELGVSPSQARAHVLAPRPR